MEKVILAIRVHPETKNRLKEEADKKGLTMSQLGSIAIMEYLEAKKAFDEIGGIDTIAKFLKAKAEEEKK